MEAVALEEQTQIGIANEHWVRDDFRQGSLQTESTILDEVGAETTLGRDQCQWTSPSAGGGGEGETKVTHDVFLWHSRDDHAWIVLHEGIVEPDKVTVPAQY